MKNIIISFVAVVMTVSPFGASFASANDGVFTGPGGAVQPGIDRDPVTLGDPNADFPTFGDGTHYDPLFPVDSEDTDNPFAPCANDFCLDPCEWSDCGCEWYDCESDYECDWGCYEQPCDYGCADEPEDNDEDSHQNNNSNTNINNIVIENYITGYGYDDDYGGNARNRAPVFTSTPVTSATVGNEYVYRAVATSDSDSMLSYTLVSGPDGMTVGLASGVVRWTPTRSQGGLAHNVIISARAYGAETPQAFTVYVNSPVRVAEESTGRVAGASAVATAEASERNTLRAFNIRVDTDELGNSVVSWDTTRPTRGRVLFGRASQGDYTGTDFTGTAQYEFATPNTAEMATSHKVVLGQLEVERVYYFRVVSFAGADMVASSERSFVQLGTGNTLSGEAGSASVIGSLGAFAGSSWFLLFAIIVIVLIIVFRNRRGGEIEAHLPAGHGHPAAHH